MKANEVRIGNWVYDLKFQSNLQFKSFFGLCNFEQRPDDFQPIPLTPEILEKAGFKNKGGVYKNDKIPVIQIYKFGDGFNIFVKGLTGVKGTYLHNLQNIVHALTGEELEINL